MSHETQFESTLIPISEHYVLLKYKKMLGIAFLAITLLFLIIASVGIGSFDLTWKKIFHSILAMQDDVTELIIWKLRMPRIMSAIFSGIALSVSGLLMQTLLKNPLGSPSTIGVSQGAAFGATLAIVCFSGDVLGKSLNNTDSNFSFIQGNWYLVSLFAFIGGISVALFLWFILILKRLTSDALILAGVALSALFVSATIFIQYFANDIELSYAVFWSFGDVGRAGWMETSIIALVGLFGLFYYIFKANTLNILLLSDDDASNLGINSKKERLIGLLIAALIASVATCFNGIIAYIGLLAPHIAKRFVGGNHLFLLPYTALIGASLLLVSDTISRVVIASGNLPVGIITSFLGAPFFLYLLICGKKNASGS